MHIIIFLTNEENVFFFLIRCPGSIRLQRRSRLTWMSELRANVKHATVIILL